MRQIEKTIKAMSASDRKIWPKAANAGKFTTRPETADRLAHLGLAIARAEGPGGLIFAAVTPYGRAVAERLCES